MVRMRIRTSLPRRESSVSHRERLTEELRAEPQLAAEYLRAAAEDDDPRVYLIALRTLARVLQ